ncbi:MAG: GntR family transcriptional regulator [Proteobacteria bacterium]|nr:GntR family transcriptional regulator [Pseudomonadota bacterium]MDA1022591.1 GntR family transcriptional regulator [Pseudomonadota bacterium]
MARQKKKSTNTVIDASGVVASLTDRAYAVIEEMIVTLQFKPGSVLSETALSERLDIGRTPIREALQRLAREGLVVILPRKGILVSEINPRSQLLLLEVRRELERLLARTGAIRCTEDERRQFFEIADGMEQAARDNDDINFMRLDGALNRLIAEAAHNDFTARAIGLMNGLSRRFWYMHYKETADLPLAARLHAELARRIAESDPDGAAAAADKLVDYVEVFTRGTVVTGFSS